MAKTSFRALAAHHGFTGKNTTRSNWVVIAERGQLGGGQSTHKSLAAARAVAEQLAAQATPGLGAYVMHGNKPLEFWRKGIGGVERIDVSPSERKGSHTAIHSPVTVTYASSVLTEAERNALREVIWSKTHRDYRGEMGGARTVLVLRTGGTTLVPLTGLTDAELLRMAPAEMAERHGDPEREAHHTAEQNKYERMAKSPRNTADQRELWAAYRAFHGAMAAYHRARETQYLDEADTWAGRIRDIGERHAAQRAAQRGA